MTCIQADGALAAIATRDGRIEEDGMNSDIEKLLPPSRHERWFDLCFRLIILALAGIWLLLPPG